MNVEQGQGCPADRPWAFVKDDGSVSCYMTQAEAEDQMQQMDSMDSEMDALRAKHRDVPQRRSLSFDVRFEKRDGSRLVGHAAVFNQLSEPLPWGFRERIMPGAFAQSLRAGNPVFCLWNHNPDFIIASTNDGTLKLSEDSVGLLAEIEPMDTQTVRDLVVKPIQDGKVNRMSFAFDVPAGGDRWRVEDKTEVREVITADLFDVSPVTYPAYPQTDISARTLETFYRSLRSHDREVLRSIDAAERAQEGIEAGARTLTDAGASVEMIRLRVRRHGRNLTQA